MRDISGGERLKLIKSAGQPGLILTRLRWVSINIWTVVMILVVCWHLLFEPGFWVTFAGDVFIWVTGLGAILYSISRIERQIKEQSIMEGAFIESTERLDLAVKGANLGMWDWNLKTGKVTYSEKWAEMLGYKLEELAPDPSTWEKLLHPDDKKRIMGDLNKHFEDKNIQYNPEFRIRTASGDWKWINSPGKVFERDEQNNPLRMVGIHIDITERKKAEEALRASEEKYRTMMDSMQDGIYICSQDFQVEYVNPAMIKRIGRDVTGEYCYKAIYRNRAKCSWCQYNKVLQGKHVDYELLNPVDDRNYSIMNVPLCRQTDGSVHKLTIARDITNIKAMSAQLLQSEKMASIGQLAAGVAHEINNPIGFVSSNLKTLSDYQDDLSRLLAQYKKLVLYLKEEDNTPSLSEHLEQISSIEEDIDIEFIMEDLTNLVMESREGTERVKKIVLDLKNFAHPGNDELQQVDINLGIESTLNVVWNELKYKTTIEKDLGEIPHISGYPQQLNQVFMNILVNAAQAIDEKGEIKIKTRHQDGFIEIIFKDTGSGIPEEHLGKLFDPFFTTKDVGKGTGLGLNIAFNIIQKHHGTIDVKSKQGQGTTFTIRIPDHD